MYDAIVTGHICLDIFPDLSGSAQDQFEATFQRVKPLARTGQQIVLKFVVGRSGRLGRRLDSCTSQAFNSFTNHSMYVLH